jgi:hypothetical protein
MHYTRWLRHGDPNALFTIQSGVCSINGCEKKHFGKGFCYSHYFNWWKHGTPIKPQKQIRKCSFHGCERKYRAKGLCELHYIRWRKHGDASVALRKKGQYSPNQYGYFKDTHRRVMEKHLNRKLSPSEHIHHINGIKTDNRIVNLQIVTPAEHIRIHHPAYHGCSVKNCMQKHFAKKLCRKHYMVDYRIKQRLKS